VRLTGAAAPAALLAFSALLAAPLGKAFDHVPFALLLLAGWLASLWFSLRALAGLPDRGPGRLAAPLLLGAGILYLWQIVVVGFGVPSILLPSPTQVGRALVAKADVLWPDFCQTFLKSVLGGFAAGSLAGFAAAIVVDRIPFLRRGLLPPCRMLSTVPIVGIAPIMVMWFGFDWESKAAVAAIVTFFPMLVNTLAGFDSVDALQRDLMHSYAAGFGPTFLKLRLPSALPFVFNALKINTTLALISAIVAEFFGSPILGLGFRISAEVARMNVDVVWAVIAVAAVAGSAFYALVAAVERSLTFWHPSYRK
jgi:NitT/TauT family transport system permease protein